MTGDKLKNQAHLQVAPTQAFLGELVFHPSPRAPLKTPAWETNLQAVLLRVFSAEHNFANKITGLKHNFGQDEGVKSHIGAPPLSEDGH